MDLFYAKLKPAMEADHQWAIVAVFLVCTVFTAMQSYTVVMLYVGNGNVSPAAEIPLVHSARRSARRLQLHGAGGDLSPPGLPQRNVRVGGAASCT